MGSAECLPRKQSHIEQELGDKQQKEDRQVRDPDVKSSRVCAEEATRVSSARIPLAGNTEKQAAED